MGCDIHLFVESREPGGPWKLTRVERDCPDCKGTGTFRDKQCPFCLRKPGKIAGYDDRNYDVFAILANVRNGRGFAGDPTGGGFIPIDEPRDLPDDMSAELKAFIDKDDDDDDGWEKMKWEYGAGWIGDHSFSYIGLDELLKFNWKQVATKIGVVSLEEFREWDAKGGGWPRSWCGGVSGGRIKQISNKEMRELIASGRKEPEDAPYDPLATVHYTQIRWTDTYAACAFDFHSKFIPAMVALGKPPADVRIVFGFDS